MQLCMQEDQEPQRPKNHGVTSADMARLTQIFLSNEQPSLSDDGNTIKRFFLFYKVFSTIFI
jgi:hypothetical protein